MGQADRPFADWGEECGARADELLERILAGGTGCSARADGWVLWACAKRGRDSGRLAAETAARRAEDGTWPVDYVAAGAGGQVALALGLAAVPGCDALAREAALGALAACDRPDYLAATASGQPAAPGARYLGDWADLLEACGELSDFGPEREVRIAAARAVAAILNYHHHPDLGLLVEVVGRDFFRFDDHRGHFVHSGAALMALAALIDEAGRGGEVKLLELAARYLRQHLDAAWDGAAAGVREALVEGAWSDEITAETQWAALSALAALVGCRGGEWELEWLARIFPVQVDDEGVEEIVRLRFLVRYARCFADWHSRGGQPAEWAYKAE